MINKKKRKERKGNLRKRGRKERRKEGGKEGREEGNGEVISVKSSQLSSMRASFSVL